jgi:hypothetical protein
MQNFLYRCLKKKKPKQKKRKFAFSLIEIVIAFTLLGCLIFALIGSFTSLSKSHIDFQKAQNEAMDHARLHLRLIQVFEAFTMENHQVYPFHAGFYSGSKCTALYFTFYPIDHEPKFSVPLNSVLFLDLKKRLCLISKAINGDERDEILAEHVEKVSFEFFSEEEKIWKNEWFKENAMVPLMLRLRLTTPLYSSKNPLIFLFCLNPNPPPINYHLEKK